jgi:isopropylmalate/homocitrate/citramalate synthase
MLPPAGETVSIVEVAARDGLQNESLVLPPKQRAEFISRLAACGLTRLEAGSFVNPKWIPAMAGTAEVLQLLGERPELRLSALTPNARGFADALASEVAEVAIFMSASEAHNRSNLNCSIAESLSRYTAIVEQGRATGVPVRAYLSVVVGCPYEGKVSPSKVVRLGVKLLEMGCYELSLGDTIGVGTPREVSDLLLAFAAEGVSPEHLALHLHDTRGMAMANVLAGLESGLRTFDSSAGGLGGCPYAPGASGNLATEDLVYLCEGIGLQTGVDLQKLVDTSAWMAEKLGKRPVSRVWQALSAAKEPS